MPAIKRKVKLCNTHSLIKEAWSTKSNKILVENRHETIEAIRINKKRGFI